MLHFYLSRHDWGGCWLVVTEGTLTQQTWVPDKNSRKHIKGEDEKAALGHKVFLQPPSLLELNLSAEPSDQTGRDCKDFPAPSAAQAAS